MYKVDHTVIDFADTAISRFSKLAQDKGLGFAIKYFKRSRLHYTRYLSGNPLLEVDFVALNSEGLPKWIAPAAISKDDAPEKVKGLLTLLSIGRCFELEAKLDLSTITKEWEGRLPDITQKEILHISKMLGLKRGDVRFTRFHYSTKKGPNGQALVSAINDFTLLPPKLKDNIQKLGGAKLESAIRLLTTPNMRFKLSLLDLWKQAFPTQSKNQIRKLAYFPDKEGKTRVIAILDYWSQTSLIPLHNHLNGLLRKISSDCTFNQNHFLKCLPKSGPYYSLDLTAATDRMPISLQKLVLQQVMRKDLADVWADILVGYEYQSPNGPAAYATGQPMGAYSSWPAMALTHHFLVRLAAMRCGYPHFTQYALLGDDIVIASRPVAEEYKKLLATLDMPISEAKTHVSNDMYEFAKRVVYKDIEVTPYSFSGLLEVWKSYPLFANFEQTQRQHAWEYGSDANPELLLKTVISVIGKEQQSSRTTKLLTVFTLIQSFLKERAGATEVDSLSTQLALPVPENYDKEEFLLDLLVKLRSDQSKKEVENLKETSLAYGNHVRDSIQKILPQAWPLRAVLSQMHECLPLLCVIRDLHQETLKTLEVYCNSANSEAQRDLILNADLVGSAINTQVFSMRSSRTRILSQSILVKGVMNEWREYLHANMDPSNLYR